MDVPDRTKVRLIEAAGEEFAEKGFAAARVRDICDRAGANVAAVNYHFGDKEKLYIETVVQLHKCAMGEPPVESGDQGPAGRLRQFIRHFLIHVVAIHQPRDWRYRLMLRELLLPTVASDVLVSQVIQPKFDQLLGILQELRPDADERRLHALAFSVVGQLIYYRMGRPIAERLIGRESYEELDLEYLTDHITSFCLAGLKAAGTATAALNPEPACSLISS